VVRLCEARRRIQALLSAFSAIAAIKLLPASRT
jgi:hypothetical protein